MHSPVTNLSSGRKAAAFKTIWIVDFEFRSDPGDLPWPVCMVAKEIKSNKVIRLWRDELLAIRRSPFEVGPDDLFVSFFASAEIGCLLELGWELPINILDLYVEHRAATNGVRPNGNGLIGALICRGLGHIDPGHKETMRDLVMTRSEWSLSEQQEILDYCASDVIAVEALLRSMEPDLDWDRALLRGRYMTAVARMERVGIPIDVPRYQQLSRYWQAIRGRLIAEVDRDYGVYEGHTFKQQRFSNWLEKQGIEWPRLPSGRLRLDDDTFKAQAKRWKVIGPLRILRQSLSDLRLNELQVGRDGRNRTLLSPFRAITGRNQPSNSKFVFGPSRWIRGLIKPSEGYALAYIDFSSQEIAIAAALSGDRLLMDAYSGGDPYMAFAIQAKLVPPDATAESHKAVRDRCKEVVLGVNYGMGASTMAERAGISTTEALELLRAHRATYSVFWEWNDKAVHSGMLNNEMLTVFGWKRRMKANDKPMSLMNFPMQANGAEMMRIAAIAATEAGIEVCAPVHDAFLIMAPEAEIDEKVAQMQQLMSKAGEAVTGGFPVRTTANVIRYPGRFVDERGDEMWRLICNLADEIDPASPSV